MKELLGAGARIAIGENPMKEIEKRPGMDPEPPLTIAILAECDQVILILYDY